MMDVADSKKRQTASRPENDEEKKHFQRIVNAFSAYRRHSIARVSKTEAYLASLPDHHQEMLSNYKQHLNNIRRCIEKNERIIRFIITDVDVMFVNVSRENRANNEFSASHLPILPDLEKVQATLKQLVRDWSSEGAQERAMCYQPIIDAVVQNFPSSECDPQEIKVLVPGAGLGRLAYEIARQGYQCEGNEFSLFMLFASNFVLNKIRGVNIHEVFPWVHQYVNNLKGEHQTRGVKFPDVNPSDLPCHAQFSMTAGDFLEVYTQFDQWDCVATCFFIDCANNVVSFIETIYNILKPGGVWLNLGPLLYHFADILDEESIEPSYEVVRDVIQKVGFLIEKEDTNVSTSYSQNPNSMLQYEYKSVFLVCRKPNSTQNGHAAPDNENSSPESPDDVLE